MKNHKITVTAVGLSPFELEALECIFQLSNRYQLITNYRNARIDIALVNVDNPDAIREWKTQVDRPDLVTVVVASEEGHYGDLTYLNRRLIRRPCHAKQVLTALRRIAPEPKAVPVRQQPEVPAVSLWKAPLSQLPVLLEQQLARWAGALLASRGHHPHPTA